MLLAADRMRARDPSIDEEKEAALVIVFNAAATAVDFVLPQSPFHWCCVFTTADRNPAVSGQAPVEIEARSVQLFELQI